MSKQPEESKKYSKPSLLLQPTSFTTWSGDAKNMFMPVAPPEEAKVSCLTNSTAGDAERKVSVPATVAESSSTEFIQFPQGHVVYHQSPTIHDIHHQPASQLDLLTPQSTSEVPNVSDRKTASGHSSYNVPTSLPVKREFSSTSHSISSEVSNKPYEPVKEHWLFKDVGDTKEVWIGFSYSDSAAIEDAYKKLLKQPCNEIIIPTNGKRHDVYLKQRKRKAFYWKEEDNDVQRGTCFYKTEKGWVPYDEAISVLIENLVEQCDKGQCWPKSFSLPFSNGTVVVENANSILHYADGSGDGSTDETRTSPRVVSRGMPEDIPILPEEIPRIDHLVLVVQGIGAFCDLRFRTVSKCVDGFRDIASRLTKRHFAEEVKSGRIGKIEFLPLDWHSTLHADDVGFDRRMTSITLPSLPLMRNFTNDTLLDILLYSSPLYGETIINTVVSGLNKLFHDFMKRNPDFRGGVSVTGHSLGSLILFDILSNPDLAEESLQINTMTKSSEIVLNLADSENISAEEETLESALKSLGLEMYIDLFVSAHFDFDHKISHMVHLTSEELMEIGLPLEPLDIFRDYLQKNKNLFRCGEGDTNCQEHHCDSLEGALQETNDFPKHSTIPESENFPGEITSSFSLTPHCSSLCPLNQTRAPLPFTIPKLDFQPSCFFALGSPIAMFLVVRGFSTISEDFCLKTCKNFYNIFHPYDPVAFRIEPLVNPNFNKPPVLIPHHKGRKRMHLEIRDNLAKIGTGINQTIRYVWSCMNMFHGSSLASIDGDVSNMPPEQQDQVESDTNGEHFKIGALNGGKRIDYVLQEKPYEAIINQYLFSLTSHATYWNSDDTILLMLKELYALHGITLRQDIREDFTEESVPELPMFTHPISDPDDTSHSNVNICQSLNSDHSCHKIEQKSSSVDTNVQSSSSSGGCNLNQFLLDNSAGALQYIHPPPLFGFIKKSPFKR